MNSAFPLWAFPEAPPLDRTTSVPLASYGSSSGSPPNRWKGMLVSVLMHGLAALLLPPVLEAVAIQDEAEAWKQALHFEQPLRIHLPGPVYYDPPAKPRPVARRLSADARGDLNNPARIGSVLARAWRRKPAAVAGPRFELPRAPLVNSPQTLLQAVPPELRLPNLRVPGVFFWAPKLPEELGAERSRILTPGHALPEARLPRFDLPPRLESPNWDIGASDAGSPLAPSSTVPVRVPDVGYQPGPGQAAVDPSRGDPMQVFSISPERVLPGEPVALPPAIQIGLKPDNSASEGSTSSRTAGSEHGGSPLLERVLTQILSTTRVAHPTNGIFDVVVESSGGSILPESAFSLSGRPVHAVFLKVGARKDWVLQYCVPAGDAPQASGSEGVVRIGVAPVAQAPFPRLTFRPPARHRSSIMVHGFVDSSGRFRQLRVLNPSDPDEAWLVLAVLQRWEFRPSTIAGRPVRVEILLAIAPE